MNALKGFWKVEAGIIPNLPDQDLSRSWLYTSAMFEKDRVRDMEVEELSEFQKQMSEAHGYAMGITQPQSVNWVKVEFVWV